MTQDTPTSTTLAAELGFSADDLAANRAGKLSEMQIYQLKLRRIRVIAIGIGVLLAAAFAATLMIFLGTRDEGSFILVIIGIGLTICNAVLIGTFVRYWLRLSADISGGVVMQSSGELERVIKPVTRQVVNYMIRVGEAEMFVSREAFELFQHRQQYTIYRAPYTGTLLSAEKLD
jgi:hypothetical protein